MFHAGLLLKNGTTLEKMNLTLKHGPIEIYSALKFLTMISKVMLKQKNSPTSNMN
jgi:hypothetical protein